MFPTPAPPAPEQPQYVTPKHGTYKAIGATRRFAPVVIWFNSDTGVLTASEFGDVSKFRCSRGTEETNCIGTSDNVLGQSQVWKPNGGFYWSSEEGIVFYSQL
jgi:hypothetical protein